MPVHRVDRTPAASSPSLPIELPNLDLVRTFAVLVVVADHLLTTIGERIGITVTPLVWHLGRVGVLTFFVHTSLVLMQSMARTPLTGPSLFMHFYVRRAFRIYPLSILCILTVLWLGVPRVPWESVTEWSTGEVLSNLLIVQNLTKSEAVLGPLWSLPYEIQMYLLLPVIFLFTRSRPILGAALTAWAASVVLGTLHPLIPGASRLDVARYGPCFLAGVVAYAGLHRYSPRLPGWTWPVLVPGLMSAYVILGIWARYPFVHPQWLSWGYCAALGLLIPRVHQVSSPALVRGVHLLARYSYGIYLFHLIALWMAFGVLHFSSVWLSTAVAVLLCVPMTLAGYHFVEKPFIALGGRLAQQLVARCTRWRQQYSPQRVGVSTEMNQA